MDNWSPYSALLNNSKSNLQLPTLFGAGAGYLPQWELAGLQTFSGTYVNWIVVPGKTVPQILFLALRGVIWAEVSYEAYIKKPDLWACMRAKT